jgi:hypothetical protein
VRQSPNSSLEHVDVANVKGFPPVRAGTEESSGLRTHDAGRDEIRVLQLCIFSATFAGRRDFVNVQEVSAPPDRPCRGRVEGTWLANSWVGRPPYVVQPTLKRRHDHAHHCLSIASAMPDLLSSQCRLVIKPWRHCYNAGHARHAPLLAHARRAATSLVIGSGGAGMMYAAIEAPCCERVCSVSLPKRSLIGRGGATVMAQMTVPRLSRSRVAGTPDHMELSLHRQRWEAGRGLCHDERLVAPPLRGRPPGRASARNVKEWWAFGWHGIWTGAIAQAFAPGHDRPALRLRRLPH